MILPKRDEVEDVDHIYLYNYDMQGYHNPNNYSFWKIHYLEHVNSIIEATLRTGARNVLEIGCAQANIGTLLAEKGCTVVALDVNSDFLTYARMKYEHGKISSLNSSAEFLPFKHEKFDVVIVSELIEHVAFPENILKEAKRCLREGGSIIITTPNGDCIFGEKTIRFTAAKYKKEELKRKQFGPSGENHLFVFTQSELKELLEGSDLDVSNKWIKSVLLNRFTQPIYRFLPLSIVGAIESAVTKVPLLNRKIATTLFFIAKK